MYTVTRSPAARLQPWLFGLLIASHAVLANGVLGGVLSYLLRKQGVGPARGAEIIALLNLPLTIYFLWSPITDFWLRRRTWLMTAAIAAAAAMLAAFRQPSLAGAQAVGLMFLSACLGQLIVASCGGMMGAIPCETSRRRASSFYQSGSLAFGALAVFVLASLSGRLGLGALGWITAAMIALPSLAAFSAPDRYVAGEHKIGETFARIWHEFRTTFLRWRAVPYTLLLLAPMGSGAMIQLLPGLAADYHIGGREVAWMNGLAGSLLMAAGAFTTTFISARVRTVVAYILSGLVNEAALAVLWLGPLQPSLYFAGSILFLFTIGASYALFTAVVLEFLGGSGKSGSARYSIINSLGNVPVVYMVLVDGKGYAHWGARGMSGVDVIVGTAAAVLLLAYFLRHRPSPAPEPIIRAPLPSDIRSLKIPNQDQTIF